MTIINNQRALIIAIRYTGQSWRDTHGDMELEGCHEDALDVLEFLYDREGYQNQDIRVLVDAPDHPSSRPPTRENILEGIKWLVDGCQSGDKRFFYYSGHGTRVEDINGDEKDGYDEGIIPCDWSSGDADIIIDDDLREYLVDSLPTGAYLTALFDCCRSGTILDMDQETSPQEIGGGSTVIMSEFETSAVVKSFYTLVQANVICWSACTDAQQAYEDLAGRGVMTKAFVKHMRNLKGFNPLVVGEAISREVERAERRGPQDPQLWISAAMERQQHLGGHDLVGVEVMV
ncbi:cytochrome c oxidase subunit 1 [Ceratobasidium sp. 394]|nr:cytochrome c oxidase subunit 1 [Ceratobasidium sp. 394]